MDRHEDQGAGALTSTISCEQVYPLPESQEREAGVAPVGSVATWRLFSLTSGVATLSSTKAAKPITALGDFFAMVLDTLVSIPRRPFAWRELLDQSWFVARVSILPALLLGLPFTVLLVFTLNLILLELGAADFTGAGCAWSTIAFTGPVVTVLVVSGAGATAQCADLGARKIREELDAMEVMGVNPIQALVVPRVLAATICSVLLSAFVEVVSLAGTFGFTVYFQHVTSGAFVAGMPIIVRGVDLGIAFVKSAIFGLAAGLIACYKGISVRGGPAAVGNAVNETVVLSFTALLVINMIVTAVGMKVVLSTR